MVQMPRCRERAQQIFEHRAIERHHIRITPAAHQPRRFGDGGVDQVRHRRHRRHGVGAGSGVGQINRHMGEGAISIHQRSPP